MKLKEFLGLVFLLILTPSLVLANFGVQLPFLDDDSLCELDCNNKLSS